MYVTVDLLKSHNACQGQVDLFAATFPDGVQVTEDVCFAVCLDFDWDWAAVNLLPPEALAEYNAKDAPIWAEYEAKRSPVWAEYKAKGFLAGYPTLLDRFWTEYRQQRAALFGRIAENLGD